MSIADIRRCWLNESSSWHNMIEFEKRLKWEKQYRKGKKVWAPSLAQHLLPTLGFCWMVALLKCPRDFFSPVFIRKEIHFHLKSGLYWNVYYRRSPLLSYEEQDRNLKGSSCPFPVRSWEAGDVQSDENVDGRLLSALNPSWEREVRLLPRVWQSENLDSLSVAWSSGGEKRNPCDSELRHFICIFPWSPQGGDRWRLFQIPKHFQTLYFSHPVGFWLLPSLCAVRELSSVFFPTSDLQRRFRWLVQRGGGEREGATLGSKKPSVMTQLVSIYTWARRIFPTDLILLGEFYEKELYLNFFQTQLILHFWNFWKAEATLESLVSERTRPQSRCRVSCVKQTQSFHVSYIHFERTLLGMVVLTFELLKFCCYWSITKKAFCSL